MDVKLNTQDRLEICQLMYGYTGDENTALTAKNIFDKVNHSIEEKTILRITEQPGQGYSFQRLREDLFDLTIDEVEFLNLLFDTLDKNKMVTINNISVIKKVRKLKSGEVINQSTG